MNVSQAAAAVSLSSPVPATARENAHIVRRPGKLRPVGSNAFPDAGGELDVRHVVSGLKDRRHWGRGALAPETLTLSV
jgi:hypothetical protein